MATGTGKSYVMFAVAYLSIILNKVDKVLIIGPSSTIIEKGLTEKFKEYMFGETGQKLQNFLPVKYRGRVINLLNSNDPIEDQSIIIENVNAIWNSENNSIGDTLFNNFSRVLILSDEVHHAYSHLNFNNNGAITLANAGDQAERRWMTFLRQNNIGHHIGFTGTPYNKDNFFTDVIFNYSIKEAIEANIIKKINPVIEDNEGVLANRGKYTVIIQNHLRNIDKYSFPENNKATLKPVTILISKSQTAATRNKEEFVKALAKYYKNFNEYGHLSDSERELMANERVLLVISDTNVKEYKEQLEKIEEIDEDKPGGKVQFVFSVNMLSEGWDVDNVFQIVPAEERAFNSKLLISQVIGRGLRLPRKVPATKWMMDKKFYPEVTITNHDRFESAIKDLLNEVVEAEVRISSKIVPEQNSRYKYNFNLVNRNYLPNNKVENKEKHDTENSKPKLNLLPQDNVKEVGILFLNDLRKFKIINEFTSLDSIVWDINRKFKNINFERTKYFNLGIEKFPDIQDIKDEILEAMKRAAIEDDRVSIENKKIIELHFNKLLTSGSKKVIRETIKGDLYGLNTKVLPSSSINLGKLEEDGYQVVSNNFEVDLEPNERYVILKELEKIDPKGLGLFEEKSSFPELQKISISSNIFKIKDEYFKTPQNSIIVSHKPEFYFLNRLLENSELIDSFIKSSDMGFYSIEYTYWKNNKDRKVGSFNPDFFIKVDLGNYSKLITNPIIKNKITELENNGYEEIILSIEIKSSDDDSEMTIQKDKAAQEHFKSINESINKGFNPGNLKDGTEGEIRKQFYIFKLLKHNETNSDIDAFFINLKAGTVLTQ
jgi:type III restriction enzyme